MANSLDLDQTAPIGAICSGSTLFASILNSPVMLGNYLQQTTTADDIFRCIFFLGALRLKAFWCAYSKIRSLAWHLPLTIFSPLMHCFKVNYSMRGSRKFPQRVPNLITFF